MLQAISAMVVWRPPYSQRIFTPVKRRSIHNCYD